MLTDEHDRTELDWLALQEPRTVPPDELTTLRARRALLRHAEAPRGLDSTPVRHAPPAGVDAAARDPSPRWPWRSPRRSR